MAPSLAKLKLAEKRLIGRQALEELRMVVRIIEYTKGISNTQLRQELAK